MSGLGTWLRGLLHSKEEPDACLSSEHVSGPSGARGSFAEDNNEFALATYGQIRQRPGNLFFSPFSIRIALGMARVGARGETAAQMGKALRITSADETVHLGFAEIPQRLNAGGSGNDELVACIPSHRRFPFSEPTIPSCSPFAIGKVARSSFSGAWPTRRRHERCLRRRDVTEIP